MPKTTTKTTKTSSKTKTATKATQEKLDIKTHTIVKIPDVWTLSRRSLLILWKYKTTFLGIILIYGLVNFSLAQGFSSGLNVTSLNAQLHGLFHGQFKQINSGLTVYALMLASAGINSSSSSGGGFGYEMLFIILASLAIIWAIRSTSSKAKVRIRDAYYLGMYPLIPFMLILLFIGLELLPMIIGISIYVLAVNNSIATTAIEQFGFGLIAIILSSLTLFWLSSSIFALYIVTLPDMTPIKALRSAKDLVRKRRWPILLRLLYLPAMLIVISAAIMLPVIILLSSIAQWLFLILSLVLLAVIHSYLYGLYRELLE